MRKLIVWNIVSLDGFYSGPGDNVMALPFDAGFSDYNAERLRAAETLLLGAQVLRVFPRLLARGGRRRESAASRARDLAAQNRDREGGCFRQSQTRAGRRMGPGLRGAAHGGGRGDRRSEREAGAGILVFGSHVLWNDLLAAGLVDELHLMIGAGVVGEGVRAFESRPPGSLRLLDSRAFDGSSLLLTRYAVER
jgi:hypothetical protein